MVKNHCFEIDWSQEKNLALKKERGISFEDVMEAIIDERILGIEEHYNKSKYPNQYLLIVEIDGYACVVPYVIDGKSCFLKTIYRSRKYQKKYLGS